MMKTISRVLITAVAAPTLAFGLPTAALADSLWEANATFAGPHGAGSQHICAAATDHGHHHGLGHGGFKRGLDCDRGHHHGPWRP
ncbi:hypothetical protein KIK06_13210 [Nocardiopsis sp. EMB25]|uniref:hypothetical protein n=1 Tax=Nocardiopsis sp. EMB25 TaxID=2835867 RepID=UPI002284C182|nr:hypothetical protein [Nocardiopsis sp. EMB25]MCY9784849.1 hypothetical protein [Nocardiopsis sp. EMB25]